ncbi:MAG: hypothetical protein EBU90_23090 [Proteobacteria bacterium]|nr:hypothetical protein [Pseudomonadota bacterium]
MKTADIKKGMRIQLRNGWFGTMMDNKKTTSRFAEVEGIYTEMGSVYSFDIVRAQTPDGVWHAVSYTEKEMKVYEMNQAIFG